MMKKNNIHNISNPYLDHLLNQAFLSLDFELPENQKLLDAVSKSALGKASRPPSVLNRISWRMLLYIVSIFTFITCLFILINFSQPVQSQENVVPAFSQEWIGSSRENVMPVVIKFQQDYSKVSNKSNKKVEAQIITTRKKTVIETPKMEEASQSSIQPSTAQVSSGDSLLKTQVKSENVENGDTTESIPRTITAKKAATKSEIQNVDRMPAQVKKSNGKVKIAVRKKRKLFNWGGRKPKNGTRSLRNGRYR